MHIHISIAATNTAPDHIDNVSLSQILRTAGGEPSVVMNTCVEGSDIANLCDGLLPCPDDEVFSEKEMLIPEELINADAEDSTAHNVSDGTKEDMHGIKLAYAQFQEPVSDAKDLAPTVNQYGSNDVNKVSLSTLACIDNSGIGLYESCDALDRANQAIRKMENSLEELSEVLEQPVDSLLSSHELHRPLDNAVSSIIKDPVMSLLHKVLIGAIEDIDLLKLSCAQLRELREHDSAHAE